MASNFTNNVISAINIKNTKYNIRAIPFHATEAEWNSVSYIPKQGEFIVYDADDNNTSPRFKTGDGATDVKRLPFALATISEVQAYVNSQIGSAGHLKRVVLEDDAELPEVSEADVDTIYMKKNSESRLISDVFEEYMVINGAWEIIGNTRVDLSNYTTQEMVDEKIETAISEIPQNDWNAKEGEPGHVLNRTHYTESGRVEVLAETTTPLVAGDLTPIAIPACPVSPGDTVIVNWNGTEYSCVGTDGAAVNMSGAAIFGNIGAMTGGVDTGEPFVIVLGEDEGAYFALVAATDGSTEATLSIYHDAETVHKLDPKYLPDGVPYCIDVGMVELPVTGEWTENDGFTVTAPIGLEIGNTYIVNWDGTEYEVVAQDGTALTGGEMPCVYIGNVTSMGANDTGEPFVCVEFSAEIAAQVGQYGMIGPVTGEKLSDIPFAIYQQEAEIRKLDNRCLDMDYLKSSLNAVSGTVELDLVSYHASTVTFGTPLSFGLGGNEIIRPITSKIIGGARLLLTFKYNLGSSDQTYHGYVTQWQVNEQWGQAKAYFPVAESSDGLYFAWISLDPEVSMVQIRLIKTSATFS